MVTTKPFYPLRCLTQRDIPGLRCGGTVNATSKALDLHPSQMILKLARGEGELSELSAREGQAKTCLHGRRKFRRVHQGRTLHALAQPRPETGKPFPATG